jgi:hypothetical protein
LDTDGSGGLNAAEFSGNDGDSGLASVTVEVQIDGITAEEAEQIDEAEEIAAICGDISAHVSEAGAVSPEQVDTEATLVHGEDDDAAALAVAVTITESPPLSDAARNDILRQAVQAIVDSVNAGDLPVDGLDAPCSGLFTNDEPTNHFMAD